MYGIADGDNFLDGMIENALLWALNDASGTRRHYLFGTMHIQPSYAMALKELVLPRLQETDSLVCETDITELADRSGEVEEIIRSPIRMSEYFSEHHFQRMRKYLMRFTGLDLNSLDHLRPLFAQQLISEYMLNMERKISLDQILWEAADQGGHERTGLESVDTQLSYIEQIDLEQQFSIFRKWVRQLSKHRDYLHRVIEWYRKQNIRKLYHISSRGLGAVRKLLIYRRNERMAEAFTNLAQSNTLFVAVGAAHLYGYKGLLRLLKHKGFSPRAVSTDWSIN